MPYTNTVLSTSLDTTYNAIAPNYTSFSSLQLITGIDLSAQLEVERVFASDRLGSTLTVTNFMNNADVKLSDKRAVYVIPITRCTLNATTSKITAIDLPASGNVYNYTYYLISDPTNANALTIQVPAIVQGSALTIRRKTVTNQSLVSWVDGSKLTSAQLNLQTKQLLYLAQEMSDTLNTELARSNDITSQIADGAVTPTKISSTIDPWSFYGTIQTVAPTANLHATTRLYTLDKFFQHGVMTKDDVAPTSSAVDILETAATAGNSGLWFNPKNGTINLWAGNAWVTVAGTPVTTANLVSTNTVQTLTAAKTFAAGTVVPFTQTGTGAVARTVDAKLKDTVSVKDFGAVGNGATDDTVAIQAAISATVAGGTLMFPAGNYIITSQLNIANAITVRGSTQYATAIIAIGCSGLLISSVSNVQIHNIEIAASVRYTTTPNAYIGIDVAGSTGTRPFNHVYRDVYIDGFYTAYRSAWLWSSTFNNFKTNHCAIGIEAKNLSVNNVVSGCSFGGATGLAGSRGIRLDGNIDPTEGWMISDTLIDDFEIGIEGVAATHVFINNCILDHNRNTGILISYSGVNFGGNWTVRGCYIAMYGAVGDSAIKSTNTVTSSQNRGNIITGNQLVVYAGSVCVRGIYMQGTQAINNAICENTIKGFGTYDIHALYGSSIITNNKCQSTLTYNLVINGNSIVKNNDGILFFQEFTQYETLGQNKVTWSYNIPTTGTWTQGDICWKSNIAAGGIPGWVCVTNGTPGTWKAMAAVAV